MSTPPDPPAASARRRATADPGVFLIPAEHLAPGFAERVEDPALRPAAPRAAATVVLLRDAPGGAEVLLLRRHRRSGFAADAWVFPGGTVDPADRDPALAEHTVGPTPAAWAHRMGITDPAEALGLVAAAIRETFEETGILLAREHGAAACAVRESGEARAALLEGRATLREVAAGEGVHLATAELLYLAHWITPEPEPRRYDTRFFLARVPEDAECTPHRAELVDAAWMRPAEAVGRFAAGEMKMLPPTVHTLAQLAPFASVDEAWAARVDAPVQAILPRMERHPDGVLIRVPRMERGAVCPVEPDKNVAVFAAHHPRGAPPAALFSSVSPPQGEFPMEPQDNRKLALRKAISAHEETEAALVDLINAGSDPKYRKMLERIRHNLNDLRVEA